MLNDTKYKRRLQYISVFCTLFAVFGLTLLFSVSAPVRMLFKTAFSGFSIISLTLLGVAFVKTRIPGFYQIKFYKITRIVRILSVPCLIVGITIAGDYFDWHNITEQATLISKSNPQKDVLTFKVQASQVYFTTGIGQTLFDVAQPGDQLLITKSRLLGTWKKVNLFHNGSFQATFEGLNLICLLIAILFSFPALSLLHPAPSENASDESEFNYGWALLLSIEIFSVLISVALLFDRFHV